MKTKCKVICPEVVCTSQPVHSPVTIVMNLFRGNWLQLSEDVGADPLRFFFISRALPVGIQRTCFNVFSTVSSSIASTVHSHDACRCCYLPIEWTKRLLNSHVSFTFRPALDTLTMSKPTEKISSNEHTEEWRMKYDLCTWLSFSRTRHCLLRTFCFQLSVSTQKHQNAPLTQDERPPIRRPVSLLIAHPEKASRGPNMRGTSSFAAPLSISIIIGKYRAFVKISIFFV